MENIFNRPPAISEDTVQYVLFPANEQSDKASATTLAVLMQGYVDALLPQFQWHRDYFQLKVVAHPLGKGFVLEGWMRVGDSIDDEWCTVWLLREISAKWDVAIRVFDTDGEFLLIEAADDLPSWTSPANAENRVWIYGSHLHIVDIAHIDLSGNKVRRRGYPGIRDNDEEEDVQDDSGFISEQHAVELVRKSAAETRASAKIENAVWKRIAGYPARANAHVHHARAQLPVDVAKALAVNPLLVQKAVETFYTRDALQLRAVHRMSRFPPEPSTKMTVKLTRTAYAQLVGQKFYPPKIFGRWTEPEDSLEYKMKDVGMKIACGFEMLYQESKNRKATSEEITVEARKEALQQNSDYRQFLENLKSVGFFRDNVEGSQEWKALENKAVDAFIEARREDDSTRSSFASQVDTAVSRAGESLVLPDFPPDAEDWLNVDADGLDAVLEGSLKQPQQRGTQDSTNIDENKPGDSSTTEDQIAAEQTAKLRDLAQKVEDFVDGKGDLEGAIFSDEKMSDEEFSDDSEDDSDDEDEESQMAVDIPEMGPSERQAAMDKLVPGLEPSEYGKMPASFYSNSQRVAPVTVETEIRDEASKESASVSTAPPKPVRAPILPRDNYDGVDSDDESDEEEDEDEEFDEDKPQVEGEIEIDMEQEQDEFLEFARQALGITEDQWNDILNERKSQGAFVPKSQSTAGYQKKTPSTTSEDQPRASARRDTKSASANNPDLNSFESLMQAMDAELAKARPQHATSSAANAKGGKGKARATQPVEEEEEEEEEEDIEAAMEAELQNVLEKGLPDDNDLELADDSQKSEYNLIKNFLESFKSQGGLSGPVGTLAGRLQPGWQMPRDEA
ncbi:hypothetical protein PHLGIDRAFT_63844 [Phlebiopsis gigantea 11061_1 CR5-6]|uniref:SGT1-domain-containing protein n=1 Tax=Phlebiopsis gigantea (strain 11061_1 CR5-6) TaxID=745531 RepID=A0A0C3PUR3_PHLG1|nr:hypothetical protein PHLGIDRAFT_63844 [Phlebiopsis gigantea 11061_1 CR5-6]